jgi:hypothetical protein
MRKPDIAKLWKKWKLDDSYKLKLGNTIGANRLINFKNDNSSNKCPVIFSTRGSKLEDITVYFKFANIETSKYIGDCFVCQIDGVSEWYGKKEGDRVGNEKVILWDPIENPELALFNFAKYLRFKGFAEIKPNCDNNELTIKLTFWAVDINPINTKQTGIYNALKQFLIVPQEYYSTIKLKKNSHHDIIGSGTLRGSILGGQIKDEMMDTMITNNYIYSEYKSVKPYAGYQFPP